MSGPKWLWIACGQDFQINVFRQMLTYAINLQLNKLFVEILFWNAFNQFLEFLDF